MKAVFFDLDGTIFDTLDDITAAINYALRVYDGEEATKEEVRGYVGKGLRRALSLAVAAKHPNGIVDEEEFAETVVRMCVENSFRSMKLSTDLNGYPESLDITVYLKKSDIGKEDPVLRIRFEPPEETEARSDPAEEELGPGEEHTERRSGYNIKDDADHYTLTVEKW